MKKNIILVLFFSVVVAYMWVGHEPIKQSQKITTSKVITLTPEQKEEIENLIYQLSSARLERRVEAQEKLIEIGLPAKKLLEAASKKSHPEISSRATIILDTMHAFPSLPLEDVLNSHKTSIDFKKEIPKGTIEYDKLTIVNQETKEFIAEGNVTLADGYGSKITGETLHWFPEKCLIVMESSKKVIVSSKGNEATGDQVFIYLYGGSSEPTARWKEIQLKSKKEK